MSRDVTDPSAEIAVLKEQIELVKHEQHRLNEAEWAILQMLEHAVAIIDVLDERTLSHRVRLKRLDHGL